MICTISASCDLNLVVPLISVSPKSQVLRRVFVPCFYFHFLPSLNTAEAVYLYQFDKFEHDDALFFLKAVMLFYYWAIDHQGNVDQLVLS